MKTLQTWLANWYYFGLVPVCREGNWMVYYAASEKRARAMAYCSLNWFGKLMSKIGLLRIVVRIKKRK